MTTATLALRGHASDSVAPSHAPRPHWAISDIRYDAIDHAAIVDDEDLFYLLMSASFVETGSDTYAANLGAHYAGHPGICDWLVDEWEHEELQHGASLQRYVQTVWPSFPWQQAYDSFFAEYSQLCTTEELFPDRRLEMVARCVVETGTTAYYHTLRGLSPEPVLTELLGHIRNDEVGHFKHFLAYFKTLQQQAPVGRARIAGALYSRLKELRESDSDIALRHVFAHRGDLFNPPGRQFSDVAQRIYHLISTGLPADLAVRMLLKPLLLPPKLEGLLHAPISKLACKVLAY